MSSPATTANTGSPKLRDDTTRFLCGAAHRDEHFADAAIREYLVEKTRLIPRSPGVNTGAVLREAVAGRMRRKMRDSALLVLTLVLLLTATAIALVPWLIAALPLAFASAGFTIRPLVRQLSMPTGRGPLIVGTIGGSIALGIVLIKAGSAFESTRYGPRYSDSSDAETVIAIITLVLIFGVLLADRVVVWLLLTKSFRRNRFRTRPGQELWQNEWKVRQLGHGIYANALRLYPDEEDEHAPDDSGRAQVIVYRGYEPFVGSGTMFEPWSMALPLKPAEDEEAKPRLGFTLTELYDHVTNDLVTTGRSPSLSPGHRLRDLTFGDRVVASAVELIDHLGDPETQIVLPDKDKAPVRTVDGSVVDDLVNRPKEWMRHFRSFQVETWDRDVVVSAYLTLGLDNEMLYIEWTPCVLTPIEAKHREIDKWSPQSLRPLGEALLDLLRFPATLPKRFSNAVMWMAPIDQPPGTFVSDKYGARVSIRELASEPSVDNYFQLTDVERYIKVLEARLLRTIGEFLQSKGISVTEFMEQAMQVTNNNVHITGPVIASNIATTGRARTGNVSTGRGKKR
ncbi:hypothetical protein [Lentzea aerocolonigenes]|uniref:hypothetical protein n=1 Tax=Lentzea aerocolonigenes TaxID=68170 RepID=UPI0004C47010|nr:hypothetical protein [Lentzea aerocolonigenes]MCP2249417.1 hypothetical protein [Lentzea aerocolonigenes]